VTARGYPRVFRFVSVQDNDVEVDIREGGCNDSVWMDMALVSAIWKVQFLQPVLMWLIEFRFVYIA